MSGYNEAYEIRRYRARVLLITDRIIDDIDTELYLTIGSIRHYLREKFNLDGLRFFFKHRELENDDMTLEDYGWTSGTCESISIQIAEGERRSKSLILKFKKSNF